MAERSENIHNIRHRSDTQGVPALKPMSGTMRAVFRNQKIGFIYLVKCHDFVKVGRSTRPYDRISTMQTCTPYDLELVALFTGDESDEAEIHRRFQPQKWRAEWFYAAGDVSDLIAHLRGEEDPERAREIIGWFWQSRYQSAALLPLKPIRPRIEDIDR